MERKPAPAPALTLGAEFPVPALADWKTLVDEVLLGADFDKRLVWKSYDGVAVPPLCTRADWPGESDPAGFPGFSPFARGPRAAGHVAHGWDIRQRHDEPDPAQANRDILEDLQGGVTSLLLRLETESSADGAGLRTPDVATLDQVLDGVFLDLVPIALGAARDGLAAARLLTELWERRKLSGETALGAFNLDPYGTAARFGATGHDPDTALEKAAAFAKELALPFVAAFSADARPYHFAGAGEAQELAAALATGAAYLRAMEKAGLSLDDAARRICFTLVADTDQFMTIAKLRAARRLWDHLASACGIAEGPRALPLHVQTADRMMTLRDPHVNILRATVACFAAACGGADSITVLPFTDALGHPDGFARRIARNIQLVLMEEAGLARVIDPAGGAWSVEKLTEDLSCRAWELFQEIEREGGMGRSLASGAFAKRLATTHAARARNIATRKDPLTGVSEFPQLDEVPVRTRAPYPDAPPPAAPALPRLRLSAPFDALRDAAEAFTARTGARPRAVLVTLGRISDFTARAGFARSLLAAGGIEGAETGPCETARQAAAAFAEAGGGVAVLCSSTEVYKALSGEVIGALGSANARAVLVAGRPDEIGQADKVDAFLHAGGDAVAVLTDLHEMLGISGKGANP